jgi:hypothetical protein
LVCSTSPAQEFTPVPQTFPEKDFDGVSVGLKPGSRHADDASTAASSPQFRDSGNPFWETLVANRIHQESRIDHGTHRRQLSIQTLDSLDLDSDLHAPSEECGQMLPPSYMACHDAAQSAQKALDSCAEPGVKFIETPDYAGIMRAGHMRRCFRRDGAYDSSRTMQQASKDSTSEHAVVRKSDWEQSLGVPKVEAPMPLQEPDPFGGPLIANLRRVGLEGSTSARRNPTVLSTIPAWHHTTNSALRPWQCSGPDVNVDTASIAYARGVAAGLARAAFERGFAAGSAIVAAGETANQASVIPKTSTKRLAACTVVQPTRCKWHAQGTCKYGSGCRFIHEDHKERTAEGGSQKRSGSDSPSTPVQFSKPKSHQAPQSRYQVLWCDQRAFKDSAVTIKDEIEAEVKAPVKCYRTAEMCMRLLRKKELFTSTPVSRMFLVSATNARALMPFLDERSSPTDKVIVLCDTCGSKGCSKTDSWSQQYPQIFAVATNWQDAINAVKQCVSEC